MKKLFRFFLILIIIVVVVVFVAKDFIVKNVAKQKSKASHIRSLRIMWSIRMIHSANSAGDSVRTIRR